jgi:uncharacterized protein YgfB (UPF0149 family)
MVRDWKLDACTMPTPGYEALDVALTRARLGVSPADLHGSITGYLCAGGRGRAHTVLTALALEGESAGAADDLHALLDHLTADLGRGLRTGNPITPLLPRGPLSARAEAMVEWCRGFLGGLALTGGLAEATNAPGVRELLDDFSQIAAMHLACEEDDEGALDDVLDFIRGGVAHLHAALAPASRQ